MGCAGPASSFDRIGSCPYRGGSGRRSPVAPNDKQVGVGACHSLDLPFAWTTLDLADSQKFTDLNPPQNLAETLHQTWADFAKAEEVLWPAYDTDTVVVGVELALQTARDLVVQASGITAPTGQAATDNASWASSTRTPTAAGTPGISPVASTTSRWAPCTANSPWWAHQGLIPHNRSHHAHRPQEPSNPLATSANTLTTIMEFGDRPGSRIG
ncbi:hypothetical protein [Streptomyces mirabilis]|uniref:hypothetical protein n=1 Tax=Streptomyces mirabilis TaxID=68239 RepID=UPI00167E378C|nr:hypothetical protein [Streptomyces mirabilis]